MIFLDGKTVRDAILADLRTKIEESKTKPKLVIFQVGNNPDSNSYIKQKKIFGKKIGAIVDHIIFLEEVETQDVLREIYECNKDSGVHGIILQIPIPAHLDKKALLEAIDPKKDVDGLHSKTKFTPATARGVVTLLKHYKILISGKKAVAMGKSDLVGKPIAEALKKEGAHVETCDSKTKNTKEIAKKADILVVAIGKPHHVTKEFVNGGQVIIDVGITFVDGKLLGDVDFENVKEAVVGISPVPGGVGPMTVASLFQNLFDAFTSANNDARSKRERD